MRVILFYLFFFPINLFAASTEEDLTRRSLALIDQLIVPAYIDLVTSSTNLKSESKRLCENHPDSELETVRTRFYHVMDDWQTVQWLQTGPGESFLRNHRVQMWPDKHGTGARQIRNLLLSENRELLITPRFATSSVAIQGLPAMEKILYGESSAIDIFIRNGESTYHCFFLQAISHNLVSISEELQSAWTGYYRQAISQPGDNNDFFGNATEPTAEFFSEIAGALTFILETKLRRPLGITDKLSKPRLKRAESWRSSRSLRNVVCNLRVLQQAYTTILVPLMGSTELIDRIDKKWFRTRALFESLPASFGELKEAQKSALLIGVRQMEELQQLISNDLSVEIGIPIGFNGMDGD